MFRQFKSLLCGSQFQGRATHNRSKHHSQRSDSASSYYVVPSSKNSCLWFILNIIRKVVRVQIVITCSQVPMAHSLKTHQLNWKLKRLTERFGSEVSVSWLPVPNAPEPESTPAELNSFCTLPEGRNFLILDFERTFRVQIWRGSYQLYRSLSATPDSLALSRNKKKKRSLHPVLLRLVLKYCVVARLIEFFRSRVCLSVCLVWSFHDLWYWIGCLVEIRQNCYRNMK